MYVRAESGRRHCLYVRVCCSYCKGDSGVIILQYSVCCYVDQVWRICEHEQVECLLIVACIGECHTGSSQCSYIQRFHCGPMVCSPVLGCR